MVTAYADLDAITGARDTGVNEFMAKPISAAALEKRIRHVLEDPRGFVEAEKFAGPDRRRGKKVSIGGPERREKDPKIITPQAAPPAKE
jgi:DNA-binding NtrC family response regulator